MDLRLNENKKMKSFFSLTPHFQGKSFCLKGLQSCETFVYLGYVFRIPQDYPNFHFEAK